MNCKERGAQKMREMTKQEGMKQLQYTLGSSSTWGKKRFELLSIHVFMHFDQGTIWLVRDIKIKAFKQSRLYSTSKFRSQ